LDSFAAFFFTFKIVDAISSYISGVRSVYKLAYFKDPPTPGSEFTLTLCGFRHLMQHRVRPVDELLLEDLSLMASVSDLISPKGKALWAAILMGVFTFFRSSTLMSQTRNSEESGHLLRSDVTLDSNSFQVSLRLSKTRQFNDTVLVYPIQEIPGSPFCPVKAW
jgi:hypothetical protein